MGQKEVVLGHEYDNVFIERAHQKTNNNNLGDVTEADESAAEDM